jgi:hypothetical protein
MAVGVDVREVELTKRQLAELVHRLVDGGASGLDLFEKRAQTLGVHTVFNNIT